jgi:signal transduction histidine kinase/ActR/RegA family two-component response regulator
MSESSPHFFELEHQYFDQLNRDLYRTRPAEIAAHLSALLTETAQPHSDAVVHFVIAYMRLGQIDRATQTGGAYVYGKPVRCFDRAQLLSLLHEVISGIAVDFSNLPSLSIPDNVRNEFFDQSTSQLHLNWYIFAWYEYHSALSLALLMLDRALRKRDRLSIGRCLSLVGLGASLSGFYDQGQAIAMAGLEITDSRIHSSFRNHWVSEAEAICATTAFYACDYPTVLKCSYAVFDLVSPEEFRFQHIYTRAILMRAALDAGDYQEFKSTVEQLKLSLGEQFDVRYTVQSQYSLALFSILRGRSDEGLRHLTIARSELYKEANQFRSINFIHCLGYEARVYMLLGDLQAARQKCMEAVAILPEGSGDGRHALELWLALWRILIIQIYAQEINPTDAMTIEWLNRCEAFTRKNTLHSRIWSERMTAYRLLASAATSQERGQFLSHLSRLEHIAPIDFAEIFNACARRSLPQEAEVVNVTQVTHDSLNIRYLELIGAWQSQLPTLDRFNDLEIDNLNQSFAKLVGQILAVSSWAVSDQPGFPSLSPIFVEGRIRQYQISSSKLLPVEISIRHGESTFYAIFHNVTYQLNYERHQLHALWLARDTFEAFLRTAILSRKREEEAHLRSVARTTAMLAHDVRAPFSSLRVLLDILPQLATKPPVLEQAKQRIEEKLRHVNAMIEDILDISRPVQLKLENVAPVELVHRSIQLALTNYDGVHDHAFRFDIRTVNGLKVDLQRMQRVLINLLSNAATIPDCQSIISIAVKPDADGVQIEVHNTGSSLPEGDSDQVFESFFTGRKSGTGLGLAIARRLVLAHGGTINAENRGGGVSFTIYLPPTCVGPIANLDPQFANLPSRISDVGQYLEREKSKPESLVKQTTEMTVLIVDDDAIYRRHVADSIRRILPGRRIELIESGTYVEALRHLRSRRDLSLAIVDVDLGSRKTGLDLVGIANSENPSLRMLIHTNRHIASIEPELSQLRIAGVLQKPMHEADLREILFTVMEGKATSFAYS